MRLLYLPARTIGRRPLADLLGEQRVTPCEWFVGSIGFDERVWKHVEPAQTVVFNGDRSRSFCRRRNSHAYEEGLHLPPHLL